MQCCSNAEHFLDDTAAAPNGALAEQISSEY